MDRKSKLAVTEQYKKEVAKWEKILDHGENICVMFYYLSDRKTRITQWADSMNKKRYYPISLNFNLYHYDEYEELENFIIRNLPQENQKNDLKLSLNSIKKHVVLIITDGESLIDYHNYRMMSFLQEILNANKGKISSFIAFEKNIYQQMDSFYGYNKLFQNILFYPLYSTDDSNLIVEYLCKKWKMKMSSSIRNSIISATGGSFWLIKEACRNYRDMKKWSIESEGYQTRLNLLSKIFSDKEIAILNSLPLTKSFEKLKEYEFLKKTGYITKENKLSIKPLAPLLKLRIKSENNLEIKDEEILLRGVSITQMLSPTEYAILKLLISRANIPMSRDNIAKVIWPNNTEEHYSSWAIDQAVKRLRDRLITLHLPPTIISSVRGVGYEYRI